MYSIEFHEDVDKDFKELGHRVTALVFKKLKKVAQNPIITCSQAGAWEQENSKS